ncbi:hypothetical protein APR08_002141 [Nocardia amikacinitolerans]|nr:hypothetical protein [Nocardia amikacinitolerans]
MARAGARRAAESIRRDGEIGNHRTGVCRAAAVAQVLSGMRPCRDFQRCADRMRLDEHAGNTDDAVRTNRQGGIGKPSTRLDGGEPGPSRSSAADPSSPVRLWYR